MGVHKSPEETTVFRFSTEQELMNHKSPAPYVKARQEILKSPQARSIIGQAILAGVQAMSMPPVQSNAEFEARIAEYFQMAAEREIPPTVEELALYCGHTVAAFQDWRIGSRKGFADSPYPGCTTAHICKKAMDLMHQIDAVLTESGKLNTVAYIFRSKNYYSMSDKQELTITAGENSTAPMTPEEIAARLPDPDYSVE